jgi:phosphatidylglycerophosphatase A
MTRFIATWFYAGLLRPAPGTWGSLASLPFAYLMIWAGWGVGYLLAACTVVFIIGWWATYEETKGKDDHDPSEIVIDEVVGQWLALSPFFLFNTMFDFSEVSGLHSIEFYIHFGMAFALFRFFDILKPWPISWADKKSTPFGVMFDDVLAGVIAAFFLMGIIALEAFVF